MTGTVQLRNRIAHGYASLDDIERLWTELPPGIEAFTAFDARIAAFLGSSESSA